MICPWKGGRQLQAVGMWGYKVKCTWWGQGVERLTEEQHERYVKTELRPRMGMEFSYSLAHSRARNRSYSRGSWKISFGNPPFLGKKTTTQDYQYKFRHCQQWVYNPFYPLSRAKGCFQDRNMVTSLDFTSNLLMTGLVASKLVVFANRRVTMFGMLF